MGQKVNDGEVIWVLVTKFVSGQISWLPGPSKMRDIQGQKSRSLPSELPGDLRSLQPQDSWPENTDFRIERQSEKLVIIDPER